MIKGTTIDKFFKVSILLKGLNALLEIIGGIIFSVISLEKINYFVFVLTQGELSEDPKDFVANHIVSFFQNFSISAQLFGSLYLISHGVIKIFLIYSLLKRRLWAYPLSIVVFMLFVFYQAYRFIFNGSIGLLVLTILDIIIILFIILEYARLKKAKP